MITLEFPLRLISKDNEKVFNRQGRPFLSKRFKDFEKTVKQLTAMQWKGEPIEGNISMTITACYENKVHPDCQNLSKSICDALNKVCYLDDRQIKVIHIEVIEKCEEECFLVRIEALR